MRYELFYGRSLGVPARTMSQNLMSSYSRPVTVPPLVEVGKGRNPGCRPIHLPHRLSAGISGSDSRRSQASLNLGAGRRLSAKIINVYLKLSPIFQR